MSAFTIGIDARELLGAADRSGSLSRRAPARWTGRPDARPRRLLLYTPAPLDIAWPGVEVRVLGGGRGTWWEQTTLSAAVRRDAPDVFFAPAYTAPLRLRAPLAVTIHDVSFSRHPEWFRLREGRRRHLLTRSAARRAAVVITVSEFSRREIVALYRVPASRVRVIRNGFTPMTRAGGSARAARALRGIHLQPPPRAGPHRRVRAGGRPCPGRAPGDRGGEPHVAARGPARGGTRPRRRARGRPARLCPGRRTAGALRAGGGLRVSLRVRRASG